MEAKIVMLKQKKEKATPSLFIFTKYLFPEKLNTSFDKLIKVFAFKHIIGN